MTLPDKEIVQCPSCDGYGWFESDSDGTVVDCDWCGGTGYVYRSTDGLDQKIPESDYGKVADLLENLEKERLHKMGYTGEAKHPSEQAIRQSADEDDPDQDPSS